MGGLLTLLVAAAGAYALVVGFFWWRQASLLYLPDFPSRAHAGTPADVGLDYASVAIPTADGEVLDAWFVPGRPGRATVLFFHGNAGNISHRLESLALFHRLGASVLIVDYRGYGRSTGTPDEQGTYEDALAAWRWLTGPGKVPAREVVVFGRSLGGAVAAWLAAEADPAGLIVESAFRSVPALAAEIYPFLPVRALARLQYDTEAHLGRVECPVLVVHSRDDEISPFAHAEALQAAAPAGTRLLELAGGHNEGFLESGETWLAGIDAFLSGLGL